MTWNEIKKAVEIAGIKETDEIVEIGCDRRGRRQSFSPREIRRYVYSA